MFSVPSSPVVAAIQASVVAAGFIGFGYLLADALAGRRNIDTYTRWGLAFPALALFAVVLEIFHIVTGGAAFSNAMLIRGITVALAIALLVRRISRRRSSTLKYDGPRWEPWALVGTVVLGVTIWGYPVSQMIPLDHVFDINLHAGWATQLMAGETTPSAAITGEIPNYYPWLFHALVATVTHFTPGGRALHAFGPMQLIQVAGVMLTLFALGRAVLARWTAGWGAVLLGSLTGGFGYVLLRRFDLILYPRHDDGEAATEFFGDLIVTRSYNLSFHNIVPPFPRDVAYLLMASFMLLLVVGLKSRSLPVLVASGVTLGMVGLTGGETFLVGLGSAVLVSLIATETGRIKTALAVIVPAGAVASIWLGPLLFNYMKYGGFWNTAGLPVELGPLNILFAWGISAPLAVWGVVRWLPRIHTEPGVKVISALVLASGGMVAASSIIPFLLGEGFGTLGRSHRYWPVIHLGIALFGALGVYELLTLVGARRRSLVLVTSGLLLMLAIPSLVSATVSYPRRRATLAISETSLLGKEDAILTKMAPQPGERCVAAVPENLSQPVFGYTGYRLVLFRWTDVIWANAPHVRWKEIYEHITPTKERAQDNRVLTEGTGKKGQWEALVDKYGVDVVLVPLHRIGAASFAGLETEQATSGRLTMHVVHVTDCGR